MYIYFESINSVITCEEYPQILSVDEMKHNNLENMCNRWEKNDLDDGTFTLSFKYKKNLCNCDNTKYIYLEDYNDYECYNCGRKQKFKENDDLYLQNSGNIDIVCAWPMKKLQFCKMCQVDGYIKWISNNNDQIFALHVYDDMLSDADISNKIDIVKDFCSVIFTDYI